MPVSPEEFEKLRHATLLLKQFRGFDTIDGVEEIISRLETAARHRSRMYFREAIQLDCPLQKAGERWVDPLYHHIQTQTCQRQASSKLRIRQQTDRLRTWNSEL